MERVFLLFFLNFSCRMLKFYFYFIIRISIGRVVLLIMEGNRSLNVIVAKITVGVKDVIFV